jgi:hypothetical protein
MAKFKVGDRVRCTAWACPSVGTIVRAYGNNYDVCLDCKERPKHAAWREGKHYIICQCDAELEPLYAQSIHIYTDGTTTSAILKDGKKTVKTAQAKCNADDTFDFNVGAKLAFDRLFSQDKPAEKPSTKPNIADLLCIKDDPGWLTKGKAYCIDSKGKMIFDNGAVDTFKSFEHFQKCNLGMGKCLIEKPALTDEQWAQFKAGKLAVNCKTEDDEKAFLEECLRRYPHNTAAWRDDTSCWRGYKDKILYDMAHNGGDLTCCGIGGASHSRSKLPVVTYTKEASK